MFYDAAREGVDGAPQAARWADRDRRHFRIILAAENGSRLDDLKSYTRAVMARAEAALGTKLEWVAVDHWDTDNPHTHIILRGRHRDGRDLRIPREYVQHGFRSAARDVATARLGERTRDDERLALTREVRAHRPSRLDQMIADQLDENGQIRIARLKGPTPEASDALKGRAHELRRLGLASEVKRNVLRFEPGWRDELKAMELHLDIRKSLMRQRTLSASQQLARNLNLKPGRDR
jgi:type IV secretory pathway VirD2 relaxase